MKNIYIIFGNNYKKSYKKRMEIIEKAQVDELNISTFNMNKESLDRALSDAQVMPFLSDFRVVVLTNVSFLTSKAKVDKDLITKDEDDDISALIKYAENPLDSTVLILDCPYESIEKSNSKLKVLFDNSNIIECKYPSQKELGEIVDELIIDKNYNIKDPARNELVKRLEDNIESYENELDKLFFMKGDEKEITLEDVKTIISSSPTAMIYELTTAIIEKNSDKAYSIYKTLISNGYIPFAVISYLVNRFKDYLICKEMIKSGASKLEVANYFKISEGRAFYLMNDVRNIPYSFIQTILNRLEELDYNLKVDFKYGDDQSLPVELFFLNI